jgi:DNA (cytosine-5)-methyltransferase 1
MITIYAADLFAGAGGASLGLARACKNMGYELELVAVNHWPRAVETHLKNFPTHVHHCHSIDQVDPLEAVPGGYLDILLAGPECTHFSRARGGKPKNRQSRANAFDIIHWAETLYIQTLIIENVREFRDWGPLDENGKVIPEFKGRDFRLFVGALEELGYRVEHRLLRSADYGDPTSRERLFIIATRGGAPAWPTPSHCKPEHREAFPERAPWRTARECIDWSVKGISIYDRPAHKLQPLAENTMRRIFAGVRKFAKLPFLVQMAQASEGDDRRCYDLERPLTTVTTKNSQGLVEPLLVVFRNNQDGASLDEPMKTLCTARGHFGLIDPKVCQFLTAAKNENGDQAPRTHSLDAPMPTVVAKGRPGDLVESFLTLHYGGHDARSLDNPLQTIAAQWNHFGLVEPVPPFLVRYNGGGDGRERVESVDKPVTTLDTSNRFALCEFVVNYNGTGGAISLADPMRTVTSNDRFGLVELIVVGEENGQTIAEGRIVGWLDILFRMLQPHELAAAQGFPKEYEFTGSREEIVAQIGNAWTGELAQSLCTAALTRPGALLRPMPDFSPLYATLRDKVIDIAEDVPADMGGLFDEHILLTAGGAS